MRLLSTSLEFSITCLMYWTANLVKSSKVKKDDSSISMFETTQHYITNLKLPNNKLLIESPRNRVYVGLLVLMKSIETLYNTYIRTNHLEYLLTFKLSQDHLGMSNFQLQVLKLFLFKFMNLYFIIFIRLFLSQIWTTSYLVITSHLLTWI